jgi:hypothetical protein
VTARQQGQSVGVLQKLSKILFDCALDKGKKGRENKKMSHRGTGEVEKRGRPVTSGRVEEFSASHLGRSVLPALVAQQIGVGVGQFVGSKVAVVEVEIRLAV